MKRLRSAALPAVVCCTFLLYAGYVLLVPPVMGVANNGDFWRVIYSAGICSEHLDSDKFRQVTTEYLVCRPRFSLFSSSASLLPGMVTIVASLFGRHLDIRFFSAAYSLLLTGVTFFYARRRLPLAYVALLLAILSMPAFLWQLNSFYGETMHMVALFMLALAVPVHFAASSFAAKAVPADDPTVVSVPTSSVRPATAVWPVWLLLFLISFSKAQYLAVAPVFAFALGLHCLLNRKTLPWRGFALSVSIAVSAYFIYHSSSFAFQKKSMITIHRYHAIFTGAVQLSDQPEKILHKLGLPPEYARFKGRSYYQLEGDQAARSLLPQLGEAVNSVPYWKIAGVYMTESQLLQRMWLQIRHALALFLPVDRRNYTAEFRRKNFYLPDQPHVMNRFWGWFDRWVSVAVVPVLLLITGVFLRTRYSLLLLFLGLHAVSQYLIVVLGEGFASTYRHFLGARLAIYFGVVAMFLAFAEVLLVRQGPVLVAAQRLLPPPILRTIGSGWAVLRRWRMF